MGLSNWKEELKLKWTKYCVFIPAGDDSDNDHGENIIFFYVCDDVTNSTLDNILPVKDLTG